MVNTIALAAFLLASPQSVERPRDIWVFRSVLDKNARMVTVELHKDLFVAYDATYCGLYKAWTGDVKLDGSVYTTVHGPQPTSEGFPYIQNDPKSTTWAIVQGGVKTPVKPQFKGYRIINKQVNLNYEIPLGQGKTAKVTEIPEAVPGSTGNTVGFQRRFKVQGLPANAQIAVAVRYRGLVNQNGIKGNAQVFPTGEAEGWRTATLYLRNNEDTVVEMAFNKTVPAARILQPPPAPTPQQDVPRDREPGLSLRIYYIGEELTEMKRLIPGQTPNYSVVIPNVDLTENTEYGQNREQFLAQITGFVTAPTAGTYEFRIFSDDGAKLTVAGQDLAENKGLRGLGDAPGTGSVTLSAGEHPIAIDWFQNAGGVGVKLEWKKPGDANFSVVPASALSTPRGEVRVTAPGKKRLFGQIVRRPGDGSWLPGVHPSFDLQTIRPDHFKPKVGGIDFMSNGDIVLCAWEPDGGVYRISNYKGAKEDIKVTRIAFGLAEPLGIKVVDDRIFVLQKQELTELIDHNKDGQIDEYRCVANGWGVTDNFHEFAFGLGYKDGKFYGNLATAINPGGASTYPQNPDRGHIVEIDEKTGQYRLISRGLRTPNGIGWGAKGQMYISDNQGDWLPVSKIMLLREGVFYGNRSVDPDGTTNLKDFPPVVWLPQNEIGNSPSQIAPLNVGPYKDQMVHGDVTHGGLKRVFVEVVDGVYQGAVFRMTQGLESGVNRVERGPDGAFYIGGVGSSGNWGQTGKLPYGLQRLAYNDKTTFEMLEVRAKRNGLEITFTEPLAKGMGDKPAYYEASHWRYVPTKEYGGPKVDEKPLAVKSVTVSNNRKTVFLELDGLKNDTVVYVRTHPALRGQSGQAIWSTETWYTLNRVPAARGTVRPAAATDSDTTLSAQERRDGFVSLLGRDLTNWKGYRRNDVPAGWKAEDGKLVFTPTQGAADIMTKEQYGDFDLRFQWQISRGGNSGVMYRVTETERYAYQTGIEYQILHNQEAADGQNPFTSAASIYALFAPEYDLTLPLGEWNESRIVARGGKVQHWLNGFLVAQTDVDSELFKAKVKESKFAAMPNFAKPKVGHLVFQNHGNPVAYRNIRIRKL